MTSRRTFIAYMLALAAVPLLSSGQTCCATAKTEKKDISTTKAPKLNATGAAGLGDCAKKTRIKITCAKCGKTEEIEIDTPTAEKPYTREWVCPKCGYSQKVAVGVAKPE